LDNPIKRRGIKVVTASTGIVIFFYAMMSIFGYFSTLGYTTEIVIVRTNLPGMDRDYF
jgi:hypothetical protein